MEAGFSLASSKVAIVGLGLMGASLAMDLRGSCVEIAGVSRSPSTLSYALENKIVDKVITLDEVLAYDLLILAAPVRTIIQQLRYFQEVKLQQKADHSIVIMDLGSTKAEIVRAMQDLPPQFDPIGGHPMCGKEVAGIQYAERHLYRNRTFVLTPLERTTKPALDLVLDLVQCLQATPLILPADRQDSLVAITSHLPYLLASALVKVAQNNDSDQLWKVAASGFKDTSRLAASDVTMMTDILLTNRSHVLRALADCQSILGRFAEMIEAEDEVALKTCLADTQKTRLKLIQ